MRFAAAVLLLAFAPEFVHAEFCTTNTPPGRPCTPRPGGETDKAKKHIIDLIIEAESYDEKANRYAIDYMSLRASGGSAETLNAALRKYEDQKETQDILYTLAIKETEELYHVHPFRTELTISKPDDPVIRYTEGLKAHWDPRVVDSGPGKATIIRIAGKDGVRYDIVSADPDGDPPVRAQTAADGRTFILKHAMHLAIKNPGYLANLLYHEGRHFNQLDRPGREDPEIRRGWASPEEDELPAYQAAVRVARIFGLTPAQTKELIRNRDYYDMEVYHGRKTRLIDSPERQAQLQAAYRNNQINLHEELQSLSEAVAKERAAQEAILEQERLKREELKRQEEARRARQEAEALAREEVQWRKVDEVAGRCGYRSVFQGHTGKWLGFDSSGNYSLHFKERFHIQLDWNDISVALLINRICYEIEFETSHGPPFICDPSSAASLRSVASQVDQEARLNYLFGSRENRSACVNDIYDHAPEIVDARAFERYINRYHKRIKKEKEEHDRRWNPKEPQRRERDDDASPPPRRSDPGCIRGDDPFGCQPRHP